MINPTLPKGWKSVRLKEILTPIYEKVGDKTLETLSISAGIGFVNQAEKFGRELSGSQYENYVVLRRGDFSFNKGNSKKYPFGCTYQLKEREIAAVPNVFFSFRLNKQCNEYFEQLFINGCLNHQLSMLINTGVRNDGLFNLYERDFYNCSIPLPPLPEQKAIAKILATADNLITEKQRLITARQKQKQWLMQNLLTGKIRLPGFKERWKKMRLGNITTIDVGQAPLSAEAGSYPFVNAGTTPSGYLSTYNTEADTITTPSRGQGGIGSVNYQANPFWCGPLSYRIRSKLDKLSTHYLYYWLSNYIVHIIEIAHMSGLPALNKKELIQLNISLPSLPEQQAIANVLTTADREIELLQQELEQQKLLKKYLMQKLLTGKIRVKGV